MDEAIIYTNDASIGIMQARKNESGKWDIFGLSNVLGQGSAEYNIRLFPISFDKLCLLCSFSGKSYVAFQWNGKWGLLLVENVHFSEPCIHQVLEGFEFDNVQDMFSKYNIDLKLFRIQELD